MSDIKRIYVDASSVITSGENNLVDLKTADGKVYEALEPRRLFPVSRGDVYITLLDGEEKEVALIRDVSELESKSAKVIESSLNDYYLVPYISAILSASEKSGTLHWRVETNRGIKDFDIRNRNHDIRIYSNGCVRVRDADDNRYIIDDYRKLDKHSRHLLISDL